MKFSYLIIGLVAIMVLGMLIGLSMIGDESSRLESECVPIGNLINDSLNENPNEDNDILNNNTTNNSTMQTLAVNNTGPEDIKPEVFNLSVIKDGVDIMAKSDKGVYRSQDPIEVSITIYSAYNISDCFVRAYGIENTFGTDKMRQSTKTDITEGENSFTLRDRIPSCYSCDFIEPGEFEIIA